MVKKWGQIAGKDAIASQQSSKDAALVRGDPVCFSVLKNTIHVFFRSLEHNRYSETQCFKEYQIEQIA